MAFPKRLLIEGEELVLDLRPHPVALALPVLIGVVALALAVWVSATFDVVWWVPWGAFLIVVVIFIVPKLIDWLTSVFAVTSDRVIHRSGLISKYSMEIPLEAINDVRFEQGVFDRIVGAGTLVISSASEMGRNTFDDIRHPEEVQKTIYHQGELNKKRMYQGDESQGGLAPSATSELERLARLHSDGVLTDEEFAVQKAKILGQS